MISYPQLLSLYPTPNAKKPLPDQLEKAFDLLFFYFFDLTFVMFISTVVVDSHQ